MNKLSELVKIRDLATELGILPPAPKVKTVELEQIRVIPKEVKVEKVSVQKLSKTLVEYLPAAAEACLEGYADPIKLFKELKNMEEIIKLAKDMIEKIAIDEAETHHTQELRVKYGFELAKTGEKLDYSADPEIDQLQKLIKERQKLIRQANHNGAFAQVETGEIINPVPIKTHSRVYLKKVKIK